MKKTIYTLIAMLAFANFTMAQVPSYVPTDSLKGWWGFNGNANDASGNGNNGTIVGGVSSTTDRFGSPNTAFTFDGSTGYINIPTLNNIPYTPITYSAWVIVNSYFPSSFGFKFKSIIGRNSAFETNCGVIGFYAQSSGAYDNTFFMWRGGSTSSLPTSATIPTLNTWHFIVYTQNASGDWKWYQNGALVNSGNFTENQSYYNYFMIGNSNNQTNGSSFWNGKLDDIGIWNRALAQTEVSSLYRGCLADTITTQPTNQIGNKGANKTISFAHSGNGNTYQWQSNAAELGWQNVPNVTPYTGATTNSLTVNNLSVSNHNQLFRVVTSKTGCKDTSNIVSLTLANIATDSLRLLRLQADSSRLTNDSVIYLARINKLMNDSAYYTSRILKLSNDSILYVSRIAKLTNDSVYYTGRITKLISDSNVFVSRINKLSNDSVYYLSRINKLSNDSVFYTGRISKLISDSNVFVSRINKLSYDSLINLGRITNLKIDSINNKTIISLLNADIVTKGNIITFLQLDSTNKGITIRQLQTDLINKHDTVYIASVITSDTLRIAIRTGILSASPLINSLKVYPNPASTSLYIDLEKPGYFIAKLSSITGQSIITPTSGTIDISALANGVYILTIYDSNNKLISTNKVAIVK